VTEVSYVQYSSLLFFIYIAVNDTLKQVALSPHCGSQRAATAITTLLVSYSQSQRKKRVVVVAQKKPPRFNQEEKKQ
jgi:hypothetical protein